MSPAPFKSIFRLVRKQNLSIALRYRVILFVIGTGLLVSIVILFNITGSKRAAASTETLSSGSFIINMGITPQTFGNGLKPYGMLFDIIVNQSVPIKWVIEPTKAKDGTDFTYNGINYKGGSFIIPSEYITSAITARISYWQTQGVQGTYTTSALSVPVYATLTTFSVAIIDDQANKENIIKAYYSNAGIPAAGYVVGTPSALQDCNNIWVNPHGDPTWASHGYLYNYVTVSKSFIWVECHAVSVMEGIQNSVSPFQRLNYLTTNGLKCYSNGNCGTGISETHTGNSTLPYTHNYPADPIMQFMGTMGGASDGGSEKWYQPQTVGSGQWRSTTKRLVTTASGISPNEGVLMAYGPAFGDPANGYVMYEAGHDLDGNGTIIEKIAAQRAFFNFVLLSGITKQLTISSYTIPNSFKSSETKAVSATIASGTAPYTYSWTSTIGGSFTNGNTASANYTAPNSSTDITGILKCTVVDACSRKNFISQPISVSSNTLPITLININAMEQNGNVIINWKTASEINNDYFTIERGVNGYDFLEIGKLDGSGNSTHEISYSFTDSHPLIADNYYRLLQTDYNGKFKIFSTLHVTIDSQKGITNAILGISPMPLKDNIKIDYSLRETGSVQFMIISNEGRILKTETVNGNVGFGSFIFHDFSSLPKGIYFMMMAPGNGEVLTKKILNM